MNLPAYFVKLADEYASGSPMQTAINGKFSQTKNHCYSLCLLQHLVGLNLMAAETYRLENRYEY